MNRWALQVQQARVHALQQRAGQHSGAARLAIEEQLQALRGSMAAAAAASTTEASDEAQPPPANRISPLAALVAHMARQQPPAGELKTVRDHRGTWVKLGMQQRLTQTLAKVPDNAGPLNTQRLMHQALSLMGDASPAYLQHFMAHVDALLTLEQLGPQPATARKDSPRASRHS
jgi:hypothetical protein